MIKKIAGLLLFITSAIYPCIGWFNINEYQNEVTIIKKYMMEWAGTDYDTNKLVSWLEKRIAFTDISPECLKAIAQILSDQNIADNKKIKKLRSMMQHDKETRVKDELKQLRQDVIVAQQEFAGVRNELFLAEYKLQQAHMQIREDMNKRDQIIVAQTHKNAQKEEEKRIAQEWNKHYIREAKQVFARTAGMLAPCVVAMPVIIAGSTYAEALVKFYTEQWKKQ